MLPVCSAEGLAGSGGGRGGASRNPGPPHSSVRWLASSLLLRTGSLARAGALLPHSPSVAPTLPGVHAGDTQASAAPVAWISLPAPLPGSLRPNSAIKVLRRFWKEDPGHSTTQVSPNQNKPKVCRHTGLPEVGAQLFLRCLGQPLSSACLC